MRKSVLSRHFVGLMFVLGAAALTAPSQGVYAEGGKLQNGQASGSFSVGGNSVKLAHAAAFVDTKDERKPTILVLSDKDLPAAGWHAESDYMQYRMSHPFMGAAFWLDKSREVFRTEYYDGSKFPSGGSGIFDLKLDAGAGSSLSGTAHSTEGAASLSEPVKLDAAFAAAVSQ